MSTLFPRDRSRSSRPTATSIAADGAPRVTAERVGPARRGSRDDDSVDAFTEASINLWLELVEGGALPTRRSR